MEPHRAVAAALLAFLVAGCAQAQPPADPATPPPAPPQPITGTATFPAGSAILAPPVAPSSFPREVRLEGCLNPRMLFFLDPADAQALLPPGYRAADATGLLRYMGFPQPPAVATGRAVAGYDLLSCARSSLDGAPQAFSQVGVFIDPPSLGDHNATRVPTNLDLYLLAVHTTSPAWQALLREAGFAAADAQLLRLDAQQDSLGVFQGRGSAVGETLLASAAWAGPAHGSELSVHGRYWHASAAGTFVFDFRLDEAVHAGAVASCEHAEGSAYAKASGTTGCGSEPRFAAVGTNGTIAGGLNWLPGVKPA